MTALAPPTTPGQAARPIPARRLSALLAPLRSLGVVGRICGAIIVLLAVLAFLAPWIAPYRPNEINLSEALQGPSWSHLLGTDGTGRDIASRLLWGARSSLLGPLVVVTASTAAATASALLAAWRRGAVDTLISRLFDIVFGFPGLLLAIVAAALFGGGLWPAVVALSIAFVPMQGRIVRAAAIRERERPYITALTLQGFSGWWICARHLLPNLLPMIVAQSTIAFGYAMVDLAAISYLGLGVQPPTADWGVMLASGQAGLLQSYPEEAASAGVLVVVAVIAFNIVGERLADRADKDTR
ncbi:ABC transporter permease [Streptomyces sp. SID3343]|uniref:ABC transporter permease n=1 Tax=Streptomyces sp. SID3343 TaxID=2690260 RepID=UPI00136C0278|nr:ABC transporter permease [Streptomyces sp. SID3343]MYW03294.1 ABC transporter permease subunit [Streptomyces sp. SID3343]